MTKSRGERRKKPRVKGVAGLAVGLASQGRSADIIDISLSGLRFTADEPIECMTQLMMTLVIPSTDTSSDRQSTDAQCEGAVVRCEPIGSGENCQYEVAVFFTFLDDSLKKSIEEYAHTQ
jgi:hypothetical protein